VLDEIRVSHGHCIVSFYVSDLDYSSEFRFLRIVFHAGADSFTINHASLDLHSTFEIPQSSYVPAYQISSCLYTDENRW